MNEDEIKRFNKANEAVHLVEDQWHYDTMRKYGFVAETKEGIGFVRSYKYVHPSNGYAIVVTTGSHADYFVDPQVPNLAQTNKCYWGDLDPYLATLRLP